MTDIRDLLEAAAGQPQPGDLLHQVRRVAARRTRLRRGAVVAGVVLLVGGVGTGSALIAQSGRRVQPAVLGPSPPAPSSSAGDGVALCDRSDLTVGKPTEVHVLAGEDGIDLPITVAAGGCQLPLSAFGFTPDAAVPVAPQAHAPAVFIPGSTVHLVLTGESDGFCVTVPHARTVTVSFRGDRLADLTLPAMGLCGQIDVDLQVEADHGEETSCTAANLDARATIPRSGDVEVTLRNTADYACFLQGPPTKASAVTSAGKVDDLTLVGGTTGSLSLTPGDQAAITLSSDLYCRQRNPESLTSLRLTLLNASGATVTTATPTSFALPCDSVTVSGFELVR